MKTQTDIELDQETIKAMRDWVADCVWADADEDDIAEMSDAEIIRGVRKHYCGGIAQFIEDGIGV